MGVEAADQWHQLLLRAEKMWEASRNDFVEKALPTLTQLRQRKNILRDLATIAPFTSLRKFASKRISDQRLQFIIDRYATYTGSDPRKAPAVMLTIAFVEEAFGAWHIKGGLGNLSTLVANRSMELGVEINLNSEVVKIHDVDGAVSAIELASGEIVKSDLVISNVDSYNLYNSMLDSKRVKSEKAALNKSTPSLSGFSILLGLKPGKARALPSHHTVFFPENYDQEFDQIFTLNQPVTDPTIYICSPDDPQMVPTAGAENLFILINAPRHSNSYSNSYSNSQANPGSSRNGFDWSRPGVVESYGEMIIDLMEAKGINIRDRIVVKKFRSPLDIEKDYASLGGSIYGPSSNGVRAAFRRAPNKSALRGLYNVGGSAHPGGGLPLVGLSGEIVADLISASVNG
jgi:phytoene desaturase